MYANYPIRYIQDTLLVELVRKLLVNLLLRSGTSVTIQKLRLSIEDRHEDRGQA